MQRIEGFGLARVIDSDDPNYTPGEVICGITGWEEYSLLRSSNELQLRKIQLDDDIPLSYHLGLLGMYVTHLLFFGKKRFNSNHTIYRVQCFNDMYNFQFFCRNGWIYSVCRVL